MVGNAGATMRLLASSVPLDYVMFFPYSQWCQQINNGSLRPSGSDFTTKLYFVNGISFDGAASHLFGEQDHNVLLLITFTAPLTLSQLRSKALSWYLLWTDAANTLCTSP